MEMESIFERMRFLKDQMNEIEKRMVDESLTLEEINNLEGERDILDAELEYFDELVQASYAQQIWEISELEEPIEPPEEYYQERELETGLHDQQNDYTYEPIFELGDEV